MLCHTSSVAASCVFLQTSITCFCNTDDCNEDATLRLPFQSWSNEALLKTGIPRSVLLDEDAMMLKDERMKSSYEGLEETPRKTFGDARLFARSEEPAAWRNKIQKREGKSQT